MGVSVASTTKTCTCHSGWHSVFLPGTRKRLEASKAFSILRYVSDGDSRVAAIPIALKNSVDEVRVKAQGKVLQF